MAGQTVYSTFDLLDEVFAFENELEDHLLLSKIITKYSDVMIDMGKDEFDNILSDKEFNILKMLNKRPHKHTYPLKPYFDNIHEEDLSRKPRDIFLLDESDIFCENSQKKYGVLVMNSNSLDKIQSLSKRYKKSFDKKESYKINREGKVLNGWLAFTSNFKIEPLNSIVLIDNHIFQNIKSGTKNLIGLFGSILPSELMDIFHIMVVIENKDAKLNFKTLNPVRISIEQELNKLVDFKVEVCIVSHCYAEEFHNRILITNYHLMKAQYGFDMFIDSKVKRTDEPEFLSAYQTIDVAEGDPEIKIIEKKLRTVKNLVNKIGKDSEYTEVWEGTDLIIGNCYVNKKVKNKLVSDI